MSELEHAIRQYLEAQTYLFDLLSDPTTIKDWARVLDKIKYEVVHEV